MPDNIMLLPLNSAYLCVDCDTIGNSPIKCWACSSTSMLSLQKVLDRIIESKVA